MGERRKGNDFKPWCPHSPAQTPVLWLLRAPLANPRGICRGEAPAVHASENCPCASPWAAPRTWDWAESN